MTTLNDLREIGRTGAAVAIHESAHAVVSALYGGRPRSVLNFHAPARDWLSANRALGATLHGAELPAGRLAEVTFAGPWAEARWRAGKRPTLAQLFAAFDGHGCVDHAALTASGGPLPRHIENLVERCWASIGSLANTLVDLGEVGYADVCRALGIPVGDNRHHRSLILAGSTPGSFTVTRPTQ